jgi:CDP-6-deoxy-D-xylo-4-hexulose-3-dehydrase
MNKKQAELLSQIQGLVRTYFEANGEEEFMPGKTPVRLMTPSYSWQEVNQAVQSLLTTQITLNQSDGNKVEQFEQAWSEYVGTRHGVMVNSGSSANLLALFALANPTIPNRIKPGDEVITPVVTWHTTVSPILCIGAVPVLVDVRMEDFTIDVDAIEAAVTPKTRAIMPVHLLGNPCAMDRIMEIAKNHNLYVIEDVCEAHGSEYEGRRCGSIGDIGTFSFFFSHHITTMEGGMVMTSNEEISELLRIMRSQGVIRNTKGREALEDYYRSQPEYADIDERYLFANIGFNLRPTELNGGFGIEQVKKIDSVLERRRENGSFWVKRLRRYEDLFHLPADQETGRAWFCFPLVIKPGGPFSRRELTDYLNECGVETRPIMAGNVSAQPALKHFPYRVTSVNNAEVIHKYGFFWGNHQGLGPQHREYVADCVDKFVARYR